jgi:hypothetical protein
MTDLGPLGIVACLVIAAAIIAWPYLQSRMRKK